MAQNCPKLPKISNIAPKLSQYFDSTNLLKIVWNLNFNIKLIELLIELQKVAQLIVRLINRSYFGDIGHPYRNMPNYFQH